MSQPVPPQLVVHCRMLHFGWVPADPEAVAAMVPPGLRAQANRQVFLQQYVVDDAAQTSGLDSYSATGLGPDLELADSGPARWYTHHLSSSPAAQAQAAVRGVPAGPGRTTIEITGEALVAVTEADGVALIRTTARVGRNVRRVHRGHVRYVSRLDGRLTGASCPYVFEPVTPFEIESVEFLAPDHSVFALRPANPLELLWGFYSPRSSFALPGSEGWVHY
ncbi:hypothetical protein [Plantactinospora endophytica]|uniref:Acetoacetate decarboxylase n=1 Tax=Plantactinospora endophytica TaxID=673535 RepID=A0ABQ4ED78_9ACTN|nr:hypothetical protein [Plantactinospora endophytica]GIG92629.1 hypothetical protein Pen02_75650 [Plantactinospora endophytica]